MGLGRCGWLTGSLLSFSKVMGVALILAGIETILTTALLTLFAFLYNLAVGIGGGLEVTLSHRDRGRGRRRRQPVAASGSLLCRPTNRERRRPGRFQGSSQCRV
ncbi:MAG: DUF3566 domain-containing protein [Candidatus Nanopelagicales bacterium]